MTSKTSAFHPRLRRSKPYPRKAQAIPVDIIQQQLKPQRWKGLLQFVAAVGQHYDASTVRCGSVVDLMVELKELR